MSPSDGTTFPGRVTARALWREVETLHAVTYFADEVRAALANAGCKGFWMGYFGARAAPMGAVGPGVVAATFANFAPRLPRRAVPDVWTLAAPDVLLSARWLSCASALRQSCGEMDEDAAGLVGELSLVVDAADPTGRPLFAANQALSLPDDPVAALWQCCTSIREHRGDGHVAALVAEGFSGLDSHLLQVADGVVPADRLRDARGWTEDEWDGAAATLVERGILAGDGALTSDGRRAKDRVDAATDRLAAEPWMALGTRVPAVLERLATLADGVRATGVIPVPNPIGLR